MKSSQKKTKSGRPRTAQDIEKLILKLAKETGWGYCRILGELKKLGIESVPRNTVKNILKRNGFDIGPKRGPGTWDEFIKRHATAMWQCDFFSKKIVSKTGLRDIFVLVVPHVKSRQVYISPSTYKPDESWMTEKMKPLRTAIRSPNTIAFVERFIQSIGQECLDHFVVFGHEHMDVLCSNYRDHYHGERPQQGLDNQLIESRLPAKKRRVSAKYERDRIKFA